VIANPAPVKTVSHEQPLSAKTVTSLSPGLVNQFQSTTLTPPAPPVGSTAYSSSGSLN
jgi:hypothetical protein